MLNFLKNKRMMVPAVIVVIIIGFIIFQQVKIMLGTKGMMEMRAIPPKVELGTIEKKDIYESTKSTGRVEAVYSVNLNARIQGWLEQSYFAEGQNVRKGQVLFLIEPKQYSIAVQQAQAKVNEAKANLDNSEKELIRAAELVKNDFVSKSYYDNAIATRDRARGVLDASRAALSQAQLDYSYTRITSPIDGKIGKIFITKGNLVNPQTGTLATIVSTSPIYVTFTMKSQDYIKLKRDNNNDLSKMKIELKLADGSILDEIGKIEFVDNVVDPTTGTIKIRATFKNKDGLLVAGDFIEVISTSTFPKSVLLIPQESVQDSTNGLFIYTIDEKNVVNSKIIKTNGQYEGKWIVTDGVDEGEKYVSTGLQKIAPGRKVEIIEHKNEQNEAEQTK